MKSSADILILPELEFIVERFHGLLTMESLKKASWAVWSHSFYKNHYNGIVDLRDTRVEIGLREIPELVTFYRENPQTGTGKLAILTDSPVATAFGFIAKSRLESIMKLGIFTMPETAMSFIQIPSENFNLIDTDLATSVDLT